MYQVPARLQRERDEVCSTSTTTLCLVNYTESELFPRTEVRAEVSYGRRQLLQLLLTSMEWLVTRTDMNETNGGIRKPLHEHVHITIKPKVLLAPSGETSSTSLSSLLPRTYLRMLGTPQDISISTGVKNPSSLVLGSPSRCARSRRRARRHPLRRSASL